MPREIRIPRLGWSMEEGTFVGWLKSSGAQVQVGEPLYEFEGEKALQEIESLDSGILYIPADAPKPGETVKVGTLLAYLLADGESPPQPASTKPSDSETGAVTPATSPQRPAADVGPRLASAAHVISATSQVRTAAGPAESHPSPARAAVGAVAAKVSSPRARRVARELAVDWTGADGTGRGGRIRESDVRRWAVQLERLAEERRVANAALAARRKVIAQRMHISHQRTVPVTLTTTADATQLIQLRQRFKQVADSAPVPSVTDILVVLVARVLRDHRRLAACWSDDDSLSTPVGDSFSVGIAVDTPEGLLVPVIHNVNDLTLPEVAERSSQLIANARAGRLTASEQQGAVFTITNLGSYGIDAFTPVINYPQTAILGLGAIRRAPVVVPDDRIVAQDRITLSLTFDHRATDGAPAAAFLRDLASSLLSLLTNT